MEGFVVLLGIFLLWLGKMSLSTLLRISRLRKERHDASFLKTSEKSSSKQKTVDAGAVDGESAENLYPENVETIRSREFPLLKSTTYLDHGGATLYAKSLIDDFSREMTSHIFGNPHSASSSSQLSTQRVDDARLRLLQFFNASPDDFDIVFVANATAGIKLVTEALRDYDQRGFWYGYHLDSHTSLVGPRNVATRGSRCFLDSNGVQEWIDGLGASPSGQEEKPYPKLFAYPAQSNMTGSRLGLEWCKSIRAKTGGKQNVFTLYDAAAHVSSSPLDLSDSDSAPDFTVLSLYKIFGFPDIGVLIVRKAARHTFEKRTYFGGGTVGMVITLGEEWHAKRNDAVHDGLEDGTLPFHSIVAVHSALDVHKRLYGSMRNVSWHTAALAKNLYCRLEGLRHSNGEKVCEIYKSSYSTYGDPATQGPVVAFNLKDSRGSWVGSSDVEKLAAVKDIHIRSGGLCNPGGIASYLHFNPEEMKRNYTSGLRCGDETDLMGEKPSGAIRVSLGAMSSMRDIDTFVNFISDFYVEKETRTSLPEAPVPSSPLNPEFYIEQIYVYPIKSCGALVIPEGEQWEVKPEGLAWDREWCLIHLGTNTALNQKKYPRMALIRPIIDFKKGFLRITCGTTESEDRNSIEIPLFPDDTKGQTAIQMQQNAKAATVCGDTVTVRVYSTPTVTAFFSDFLSTPCTLARLPPQSTMRYYKPRLPATETNKRSSILSTTFSKLRPSLHRNPILLSNESPMLLVSRSSVNRLNEEIKTRQHNAKTVPCNVFRANIIVSEDLSPSRMDRRTGDNESLTEHPYIEDHWSGFRIGNWKFDVLSSCQRCQMVCIDQDTGVRSEEPYSTLAKTRKINGKVYFGRHICLANASSGRQGLCPTVKVGDRVEPFYGRFG
ncbi:molybdenum cofactor sulfurase protein, putative [Coccidioides posadasii C735 delta SOWgp]|uniref:Molybdenum cofactor sulfurase n=1 Tax=Coccidioides posadasii (strain C735) TaxID=222929 RepID=C5P3G7_COCP7|nr:molybdenum cofactor sulfurase protein, putative [Coccidioides posadasii C735 delta SOWgp]EER28235.1 molybdenum cofactor sulfurase protein, putative [Coccidioides posadasii C735 delta SOWgp]|eukprot:XP_003070380.1 molybdenum cofactor sulfurase protein, putative [Coccidioides posadasii C735 delta SOWgp]